MPVLHHSVSGRSTGAVSNWYECKRQWGPYLESKYGRAGRVIRDGKFPAVPEVPEPVVPADASAFTKRRLEEEYAIKLKAKLKEELKYEQTSDQLFSFVWSHMAEESRALVESSEGWNDIESARDIVKLIELIGKTHLSSATGLPEIDKRRARAHYNSIRQGDKETLPEFKERFDFALKTLTATGETAPSDAAQAADFLAKLDLKRYQQLSVDLENAQILALAAGKKDSTYPSTLVAAYNLASNYKVIRTNGEKAQVAAAQVPIFATSKSGNGKKNGKHGGSGKQNQTKQPDKAHDASPTTHHASSGATSESAPTTTTARNESTATQRRSNVKCFKCGELGHVKRNCPKPEPSTPAFCGVPLRSSLVPVPSNTLAQVSGVVGPRQVGIDTFGGTHCFGNKDLLCDLQAVDAVHLHGVGGHIDANQMGTFALADIDVYYSADMPVNMLSWALLSDNFDIEWDQTPQRITVHFPKASLVFKRIQDVYVLDVDDYKDAVVAAVATVDGNRQLYARADVEAADQARILAQRLGGASDKDLAKMCRMGVIKNNPVAPQDIHRATRIYGPDLASVRGKTTRKAPPIVNFEERIPRLLVSSELVGHLDLFFVEGIPFLLCVATPLYTCHLKGRTLAILRNAIQRLLSYFKGFGFGFRGFHVDGEGAIVALEQELNDMGIQLNVTAKQPVPLAEVKIKQIKERARGIISVNPFTLCATFLVYLIAFITYGINCVPSSGMSEYVSPWEALSGRKPDYSTDLALNFCEYVEVHERNDIINTVSVARTRPALALHPRANRQGSWVFFLLDSEKTVTRDYYTRLPMPNSVIEHMERKARQERGVGKDLKFRMTRANNPLLVIDENLTQQLQYDYSDDTIMVEERATAEYVESHIDEDVQEPSPHPISQSMESIAHRGIDPDDVEGVVRADDSPSPVFSDILHSEEDVSSGNAVPSDGSSTSVDGVGDTVQPATTSYATDTTATMEEPPATTATEEASSTVQPNRREGLRPRPSVRGPVQRWQEDGRWEVPLHQRKQANRKAYGLHISLRRARAKFNVKADEAAISELSQLHRKIVWELTRSMNLNRAQRRRIIRSSLFLKEKFNSAGIFDKLKARLVAGGHMQDRSIYSFEETTSPTVNLSSVYMIAGIAAMEKRHVASMDIGGAYLNAKIEKDVFMRIDPDLVVLLERVDPIYGEYKEPDGSVIVKLKKALYGLAESSKLWYSLLTGYLEELGFKRNGRDKCVFNKIIDDVQCTVCVYVDDILCTSTAKSAIERVFDSLKNKFNEVTINWGPKISYLGQTFDFSNGPTLKVTMEGYVADLLNVSGVNGMAATPALENLFDVTKNPELLNDEDKENFHSLVAKLLYLSKRVRPDLLLVSNFLCTRVSNPTVGDMDKLTRALKYLHSTQDLGINIDVNANLHVIAYVDASYAVHKDFKSHTGAVISLGQGPIYVKSTKQKINTKSSTEAEIVAVSDALSQIIWVRDFLAEQGYRLGPAKLLQDNTSSILMLERGEATAEKSRHIGIRFFFAKDKIDSGEIAVEWLATGDMIADILTKPLQGELFRVLRNKLLNV